jgi:hypothetical protein
MLNVKNKYGRVVGFMKGANRFLFLLFIFFVCLTGMFFAEENSLFRLVSFSVESRLIDHQGRGIPNASVSLYCIDFLSGKEILFFSGRSDSEGDVFLTSQTDTSVLPSLYACKLVIRTPDFEIEKIIENNPVLNKLLDRFNPIVLETEKNASLFESEWVATLDTVNRESHTINAYYMRDKTLDLADTVLVRVSSNVSVDVYVNNAYVGKAPIELTLSPDSENGVYFIRLIGKGYEEKILMIDISDVDASDKIIIIEEYVELKILE